MITSLFTTKGGTGKSSTVIALCGAIAERNSKASEKPTTVCVVDADRQATTYDFYRYRQQQGLPNYSIDFRQLSPTSENVDELLLLNEQYDEVLVDLPGYADIKTAHFALESDVIVVPLFPSMAQVKPAVQSITEILSLVDEVDLRARTAILVTRVHPNYQFWKREVKALYGSLIEKEYPMFAAWLPESAVGNSADTGVYPFEMLAQGDSSAGVHNALKSSSRVWEAIKNFDIIQEDAEESADV